MKKLLFYLAIVIIATSCAYGPRLSYNVGLSKVESPKNAKLKYGDIKITTLEKDGKTNYHYEDDFIDITWVVTNKQFDFILVNKSNFSIKIPWDDAAYIDAYGETSRIMHKGIKYNECNDSQPATIVPKGATLCDLILPTSNVYYLSGEYGGWRESNLFYFPIKKVTLEQDKQKYIGKTVHLLFPIIIQNVENEYSFEFKINDITKK